MKRILKISVGFLAATILLFSCKKFSVLNTDPNNITPANAAPDYLMTQVLTSSATFYGNQGSGNMSGAMQQTYQDAFGNSYSFYNWDPVDWTGNYGTLRDNKLMMQKAADFGWNFHQGVGLIMRAFNYGVIADFWGDAPDSMALKGTQNGAENQFPVFDDQQAIYASVIADLKAAIPFLTGATGDHPEITGVTMSADVFYGGDPEKWTKLANTLLLRYYMRLSAKQNVQADVEALVGKVFASNDDDWAMPFPGIDQNSSYQKSSVFTGNSNYNRNKMCATLVKKMDALKDPRIVIMAEPIVTPSVLDQSKFAPGDNTTLTSLVGNVRYINPAAAAASSPVYKEFDINTYATDRPYGVPIANVKSFFDTSPRYVGIPISYSPNDFSYNLNGTGTQSTSLNNYVSYMRRDIYDNPSGDLLKQRMASYAEVCFDMAEAAQKGWNVGGSAQDWYNMGVQASFDLWQVFSTYQGDVNGYAGCVKDYNTYIAQPLVAYDGTLARIMEQKWIASWQASCESYMDWRRTGLPALSIGYLSWRQQIPLRFAYINSELQNNPTNSAAAIAKLAPTAYNGTDGNNSPWSKFWLLQGTNLPW
ncbi:MAG TPA: SusD/RagB family nutrient-binding outer membrane lipoprotein [Puia sp.]|nr:SusD/RagB family nutrient-binding outer membrane lipoprotein [Puia sp.]